MFENILVQNEKKIDSKKKGFQLIDIHKFSSEAEVIKMMTEWKDILDMNFHMVSKLIGSVFRIFVFKMFRHAKSFSNMAGRECAKVVGKGSKLKQKH